MGPRDGANESRRVTWSVSPGIESTVRMLAIVALVALGVWAPAVIRSDYWLGLLINAMILGLSAVSIGFLRTRAA